MALENFSPEERRRLYGRVIGERNTERYRRIFERFDARDGLAGFLSWNWSAFFFTGPWLAYRRMPGLAALYVLLAYLLSGIAIAAASDAACPSGFDTFHVLLVTWFALACLALPAAADWLYYRRVRRVAAEAAASGAAGGTGTSPFLAGSVAIVVGLWVLMLPAGHSGYTHRARLSEMIVAASAVRTAVAAFYEEHKRLPSRGEVVPASPPGGKVRSLTVGDSGVITAVSNVRCFEGQSIVLTPAVAGARVQWRCSTPDIPFRYVPAECRQRE